MPFASGNISRSFQAGDSPVADLLENLPCFRFDVIVEQSRSGTAFYLVCLVHVRLGSEIGQFGDFGRYYAYLEI
jgi:hypothetical protein